MTQQQINGKSPSSPFPASVVVSSYSRVDALRDGFLIDVSERARSKRFTVPVAVTSKVWSDVIAAGVDVEKEPEHGPTLMERIDAILDEMAFAIRQGNKADTTVVFSLGTAGGGDPAQLCATASREDVGEERPAVCLTIMMQGED